MQRNFLCPCVPCVSHHGTVVTQGFQGFMPGIPGHTGTRACPAVATPARACVPTVPGKWLGHCYTLVWFSMYRFLLQGVFAVFFCGVLGKPGERDRRFTVGFSWVLPSRHAALLDWLRRRALKDAAWQVQPRGILQGGSPSKSCMAYCPSLFRVSTPP